MAADSELVVDGGLVGELVAADGELVADGEWVGCRLWLSNW